MAEKSKKPLQAVFRAEQYANMRKDAQFKRARQRYLAKKAARRKEAQL